MSKVLVAVASHADDAELNAGGLMAKWVAAGGVVHIVMVTNNCSGLLLPENGDEGALVRAGPAETSAIRRREQDAAAALIGATVHYLGYNQRHYWDGSREVDIGYETAGPAVPGITGNPQILLAGDKQEHIERMAALLESLQPDLVVSQTPLDIDPEHHAVARLAWQAFRLRPGLRRAPLCFWSPSLASPAGMVDPEYDRIEDVSDYFELKQALCACHASQMTARRRENYMRRASFWGKRIGVRYAEPFRTVHWEE